ncbi:MAG: sigma-54 dependent transcriptional regulator [Bacteroidales bacterium]|nr:sigma-54 dependent transcriptional regulator [Bacteroidales bacterium]
MSRILIIDDDVFICNVLEKHLGEHGYEVESVYSISSAKKALKNSLYDLVLCDYRFPRSDGSRMLQVINKLNPGAKVVFTASYGDVKTAIRLIKEGAENYIVKPIRKEELLHLIDDIFSGVTEESNAISTHLDDFFTGKSREFKNILKLSEKVAPTKMAVLIEGETGSGKEYIARYIHKHSDRSEEPFVALDCGAIPRSLSNSELFGHIKGSFTGALADKVGVFQAADGGTLFLDEVGNMDYDVQVKLLRTVQENKISRVGDTKKIGIDVRIIAASNEDLKSRVKKNHFREDLYHRLNEFYMRIPALRDRRGDIDAYTEYFVSKANQQLNKNISGVDEQVRTIFHKYAWEGNLRELRNVIKRSVLLAGSDLITADTLPDEIRNFHLEKMSKNSVNGEEHKLRSSSREAEKEIILETLKRVDNNKSKAARILDIDRKTLYNKMKKLSISLNSDSHG